jgi:hypothetical protein
MYLATDEDLARHFPDGFLIGTPVRPPNYKPLPDADDEHESDDVDERDE